MDKDSVREVSGLVNILLVDDSPAKIALYFFKSKPLISTLISDKVTIVGRKVLLMSTLFRLALILFSLACLTACAGSATQVPQKDGVVVTFRVADAEEYKIRLTDPVDIDIARKLLAGEEAPHIPNGVVVRGDPDINVGYARHIDPESVEFC